MPLARKTLKGGGINRIFGVAPKSDETREDITYNGVTLGFSKTNNYPVFSKDGGKTWKYLYGTTDVDKKNPSDKTAGYIYDAYYKNPLSRACMNKDISRELAKQPVSNPQTRKGGNKHRKTRRRRV